MVSMWINIKFDKEDTITWFKNKLYLIEDKIEDTVGKILESFLDRVQEYSPVVSSELKDSWEIFWHGIGGEILSMLDRATWVLEGTEPHDIYPVNKEALYWEGAEHPVKHVFHPGTSANDFVALAWMDGQQEAETFLNEFMDWLEE